MKRAKSPDFASQSSSSILQFNISTSYMLSCLSVLKILSDTQQIFQEVNVQRGITLLTDGTCHHDRTGNTTDGKNTLLVRIDTKNKPNIAIILQIHKVAPSLRGKYRKLSIHQKWQPPNCKINYLQFGKFFGMNPTLNSDVSAYLNYKLCVKISLKTN